MFKKLINRSESSQVEINDSALRDIIPSNDMNTTKKSQQKQVGNVCKILIFMFILGLVAIGIVLFGLFIAYSGKSFIKFLTQSADASILQSSNKTRTLAFYRENLTQAINEQDWKKITVIPNDNNQKVRTKQEIKLKDTTVKDKPISTTMQTITSTQQLPATTKTQDYFQTSQKDKITTVDILTSSLLVQKIHDYATTSEKITLAPTSTNSNRRRMPVKKQEQIDEDNIIDDFL